MAPDTELSLTEATVVEHTFICLPGLREHAFINATYNYKRVDLKETKVAETILDLTTELYSCTQQILFVPANSRRLVLKLSETHQPH